MKSPMTPSHLTLSDLDRSKSKSLRCRSYVSCKGAELGHMLQLNINRQENIENPLAFLHLTPVTLKGQC